MKPTPFEEVVSITEEYLGPAARRFVVRQVAFHLKKAPEKLELKDLPQLSEWTKATLALLTDDRDTVEDYASKLHQLAERASV
jgi:hypothetical protein